MEVGNDTGIQPDYLRKKGNKKRQIPAMGNWRTKNSHYYAGKRQIKGRVDRCEKIVVERIEMFHHY